MLCEPQWHKVLASMSTLNIVYGQHDNAAIIASILLVFDYTKIQMFA